MGRRLRRSGMGWRWIWSWTDIHSSVPSPDTNARRHERKNKRTPQRMDNQSHRSTIYISLSPFCLLLFSLTYTPNQPKQPCTNLYVAFSQVSHLSIYLLSFLPIRISFPSPPSFQHPWVLGYAHIRIEFISAC